MGPDHFWWGGWWMFPVLMPVVMLVVLFTFLYLVFGRGGCRPSGWGASDSRELESAMDILKKRYAKGELTRDEFERMKRDILG